MSAARESAFQLAMRDAHIEEAPGMLLSRAPGAAALSMPEAFVQDEWENPFPYGPRVPFGLAFREPDPETSTHPRVRVHSGAWRYRNRIVVSATANLLVQDAYRWIVLELTPHDTAPVCAAVMWDEACDYTKENADIETIHDKSGKLYIPLALCYWHERTNDDDTKTEFASLVKWWAPVTYPSIY